jgi:hypothetical protein
MVIVTATNDDSDICNFSGSPFHCAELKKKKRRSGEERRGGLLTKG